MGPDPVPELHRGVELIIHPIARMAITRSRTHALDPVVAWSMRGEVIVVLHEHAILGKGQTMHSSGQMEHHRNLVHQIPSEGER